MSMIPPIINTCVASPLVAIFPLGICLAEIVVGQSPDALAGNSGWVGAGLLGAILLWLFTMHLPAKDKQLKELLADRDKQLSDFMAIRDKQSFDKDERHYREMDFQRETIKAMIVEHAGVVKAISQNFQETVKEMNHLTSAMENRYVEFIENHLVPQPPNGTHASLVDAGDKR